MADVPLQVISENAAAERRITPSWTISILKTKLETVTGIPPGSQRLSLKLPGQDKVFIEANDEDNTLVSNWALAPYAELHVSETRPAFIIIFSSCLGTRHSPSRCKDELDRHFKCR